MDRNDVLGILSSMARKKLDTIEGHSSLGKLGISSSFGVSALKSRLGVAGQKAFPRIDTNTTVDQLVALLAEAAPGTISQGSAVLKPLAAPLPRLPVIVSALPESPQGRIGIGIDMQEINSLPETDDYRTHEFYASHFLPNEIATAMLKPDPRASLCGMFCAKEAAKKSHDALLMLRMDEIVVEHELSGRPGLRLVGVASGDRFRFQVSITHTGQFAAATCITTWSDS